MNEDFLLLRLYVLPDAFLSSPTFDRRQRKVERDISLVAKIKKNQDEEEAHHDDDNDVQVKVSSLTIFIVSYFRARAGARSRPFSHPKM